MKRKIIFTFSLLAAICFAGFWGAAASASTYSISITDSGFDPANIQINQGDTVIWTSNGQVQHTVTSGFGAELNSGTLYTNNVYSHIFNTTGIFAYHCSIHPSMQGTINVVSSGSYQSGNLSITKKVINLTSRNLNWQASVNANPSDILAFAITLQATGRDFHNITVRDILPPNLIYRGNLLLNAVNNFQGNPANGINVGTLPAGEIYVISYQVQVDSSPNIAYGTTALSNSASVASAEAGSQTASASVIVNNSAIQGATYLPTGATNNPIKDSFFLPIFLIILGSWFYFSGNAYKFADWLGKRM